MEVGVSGWFRTDPARYVLSFIRSVVFLIGSLASRYRNKDEKDEEEDSNLEKIKKDRSLRMYQAMERLDFATKSPKDQAKASDDY
jgi:hypothetical protein